MTGCSTSRRSRSRGCSPNTLAEPAPAGVYAYWVRVTQQPEPNATRSHQGIAYSSPIWLTTRA